MIHILLILGGIAIGWLTKIPWFWKYYNEVKRENQEIREVINRLPWESLNSHAPSPLEGSITDFTKHSSHYYDTERNR